MARQLRSASAHLGRSFENRVKAVLTERGWWVIRAAGSKGKADLVAMRAANDGDDWYTRTVLVNVKRGGRVYPAEWNELWGLADDLAAVPVVAYMPGRTGIAWKRMIGSKRGRGPQPWIDWEP